jgi:hypothetical protein
LNDIKDLPHFKYLDDLADRKLEFSTEGFQKKLLPSVKLPQHQDKLNMDVRVRSKAIAMFATGLPSY